MKKIIFALTTALISLAAIFQVYAGNWQQSDTGWWYQNDDSSYSKNGWQWIDGKCYYFDSEGYCLLNTQTPDGYTVDASGALTVDGHIMEMENPQIYHIGNLALTFPQNFHLQGQSENEAAFLLPDLETVLTVYDYPFNADSSSTRTEDETSAILDSSIAETFGTYTARSSAVFSSGNWTCYDYASYEAIGPRSSVKIYTRMTNTRLQMIIFAGRPDRIGVKPIMDLLIPATP